jgi:hypothetical protein
MVEWEADLAVDLHEGRDSLNTVEVALYLIRSYKKDLGYQIFPISKLVFWDSTIDPIIR